MGLGLLQNDESRRRHKMAKNKLEISNLSAQPNDWEKKSRRPNRAWKISQQFWIMLTFLANQLTAI